MFACYSRTIHTLPSDSLCFVFKLLLPSKCPCVCHRRTFCFQRAFGFEGTFRRRAFPIERPLPSEGLCHRRAFGMERPLPSTRPCLCHRRAFAFKVPLPLPSKGLWHRNACAIELPLPLKGLCHRSRGGWKPFPACIVTH